MALTQLTGLVVHVDPPSTGPVLRSTLAVLVRVLVLVVVLPAALLAFALIKFSLSLAGSLAGGSSSPRGTGFFGDYVSDTLAHLTAERMGTYGRTMITEARIRDSAGRTWPVRFEGHFLSGALSYGDQVVVRVRSVDGISVAVDGQNHTTRQVIRLRR